MPSALPPDLGPVDHRAQVGRIRFRRAIALMVMTLVLPGSAQLVSGHRRVGRIAMRIWFGLLLAVLLAGLLAFAWRGFIFWFAANTTVLALLRLTLIGLALGWAYLFFDAWRLGSPLSLLQRQRLAMVGLNGFLVVLVAGSLLFASHLVGVQRGFISAMFTNGPASAAEDGRYNVLLLGGDAGADRWGMRPDSITLASIDAETGATVLFGLPRNMRNFPFAKGSIMAEQFPEGYDCGEGCELNSLSTWAADHERLFGGIEDPGVEATRQAVEGITGLTVHYYAMVNMRGFEKMVDALGGVRINVRERIPIGGIGAPVTGYVEPGHRTLNGFETLWFTRSRVAADDYSRMARQKCVMNAMLQQVRPQRVVMKFEAITQAGRGMLSTDLPASEVDSFAQLALKARNQPVRSVSFVPPLINTGKPDITLIRQLVRDTIDPPKKKAAAKDEKQPASQTTADEDRSTAGAGSTGGALGSLREGYAANQAADLGSAC